MIETLSIRLELLKDLSIAEVFLLAYIEQNVQENGLFTDTDQQISKALKINQASLPTLINKLKKQSYIELVNLNDNKRYFKYVPVPNDSEQKDIEGYIYILEDTSLPGYFKIGFSKQPGHREKTLQAQKPTIRLIKKFIGSMEQEKATHRYLSKFRVRGEWFTGISVEDIEKAIKKIIGI